MSAPEVEIGDPEYNAWYHAQRMAWRKSLSNVDCRSLAYEYKVASNNGKSSVTDTCLIDAMAEYKLRFSDDMSPRSEFVRKPSAVRPRRSSSKYE